MELVGSEKTSGQDLFSEDRRILWEIILFVTVICDLSQRRRRREQKQIFGSGKS